MLDRIFQHRILTHILYWVGILVAYPIYAKGFGAPIYESFIFKLGFLPGQMLAAYFLIYYQIPHLIYKRKYFLFFLTFLVGMYVFPVIAHLAEDFFVIPFLGLDKMEICSLQEILSDPFLAIYQITAFLIPFVSAAIKIVKERFEEKEELEKLEREKADAELQFLKAQIHPHFLFNTLEHLHTLSVQQSDQAPEVVVKLSEMLDYMLYQGQAPLVSIEKEINLLQHYIDLEKLQQNGRLECEFEHDIAQFQGEIPPLLLLSVLEYAFKSGLINGNESVNVKVELMGESEKVSFRITMDHSAAFEALSVEEDKLRRQLALSYPDKYSFEVNPQERQLDFYLILYISS